VSVLSKSSKKRQASGRESEDYPAGSGVTRKALFVIAGAVIICLVIAGIWLIYSQAGRNQIVGTWTDQNNFYAYAYYSNGSIMELGWLTQNTGNGVNHIPAYVPGTWSSINNSYYIINPDIKNNATFEAMINGTTMSIINMPNGITHKISDVPDVNLVNFNYAP
jgi:hypothetical protein